MADMTLVPGIPFPVTQAAATFYLSMPANLQADIRARPLEQQKALFGWFNDESTLLGYKTYQDAVAAGHQHIGPLDFSGTPLGPAAGAVNSGVSAVSTAGDVLASLGKSATWVRIAEAVVGGALVIAALSVIAKPVTDSIPKGAL